ncbi:uncharacterized protein EAE97_002472 [Botrytis byssoidea]|uniref:Helicase ATP-binding domain-containing protein n=1 Tax=Botrytis byssoidea TaxID=139641 RepID=A0A9P5IR76_9HELO|nr:uncharacterized protein EAE97_002472 [Botrytis byssoidea]KAF7950920.1 hypothetical protein EAE97_002472 [Botrytis byssoidea]
MEQTPPESSPMTDSMLQPDEDLILDTESQWKLASMSPKTTKHKSYVERTTQPHIKAEDNELEEVNGIAWVPSSRSKSAEKSVAQSQVKAEDSELEETDAVVWSSSRAGSTVQTHRKRSRTHSMSSPGVKLEGDDVRLKTEASDFSSSDERQSPSKRRRSIWGKSIPYAGRRLSRSISPKFPTVQEICDPTKSSRTPSPEATDSSNGELEYEYDLENSDFSDIENDDNKSSIKPEPPEKKRRESPMKTSREWWARSYRRKARFYKRKTRRAFANDGVTSKINNLMSHNPIDDHRERPDEEGTPGVEASSKKEYFDLVLRNIRTDGRIHKCRGDKTALKIAGESFGRANVKYKDENRWSVKGLNTALYHHQLLGASWMLGREFDPAGPPGGLVCDVMGLGKTVEILAMSVGNPRLEGAEGRGIGPTLIVVPSSISAQWVSEVAKHLADADLNVILYSKSQKLSKNTLIKADLVITSYDQIRMSSPFPPKSWLADLALKLKTKGSTLDERTSIEEWIDDNREEFAEVLHKIEWHRIVLDEAHYMKNHESKTSYAASALLGKYRWLMTGTPMMNKREELYSYFRFLKLDGISSLANFNRVYGDHRNSACNSRLDEILSRLVLRRTMQDQILGKELITLPTPHKENPTELFRLATRNLYRAIEAKFREIMAQQEFADSDPRKKMKYLIVMILRLRQFTASPLAIEPQIKALFNIEELQELRKGMNNSCPALYERMGIWIDSLKSGHGPSIGSKDLDVHICESCNQVADDPQQIRNGRRGRKSCDHVFCQSCIDMSITAQIARTDDIVCPAHDCGREFNQARMISLDSWSTGPEDDSSMRKGRDALGFLPRLSVRSEWLEDFDKGTVKLPHTPKVEAIKKKLQTWRREAPSDKKVIFVQWKLMMRLTGIMLEEEDFHFLYYTGEMNAEDRKHTLLEFEKNPEITILVIGLKVGGVGLNLAFANRAIMVDLWWNSATESQAYGRIFRLGQLKETYFVRFMMRESVDIRLLRMQVFKSIIIDGTLEGKTTLTWTEALSFLGEVKWGDNGDFKIDSDYDKLEEWLGDWLNKQNNV